MRGTVLGALVISAAVFSGCSSTATPIEVQQSPYRKLHETLAKHGNNQKVVRPVDFSFFFASVKDRTAFLTSIEGLGFKLNEEGVWESENGKFWCAVVKEMNTVPVEIDGLCAKLEVLAGSFNGELDGWACPVKK